MARKRQLAAGKPPRYPGTCRELTEEQRAERLVRGVAAALRFRVPAGEIVTFNDLVHGEQRFNTDDIGDFIIRRTDGGTAFFFSNALDDALMGVTLVIRGDDHMTNTPRQILILNALDLPIPRYAHVALLLGMDGAPLSKRQGALSLQDLRKRGYLPGAVRNHLVRLGHSCVSDGWLDDAAMLAEFDLARLGRAAAKFDDAQLLALAEGGGGAPFCRRLSVVDFRRLSFDDRAREPRAALAAAIRPNVTFPADAKFWVDVITRPAPQWSEEAKATIRDAGGTFFAAAEDVLTRPNVEFRQAVRELGQQTGRKGPSLFMPLRAALTTVTHGPELAPLLALIPADEVRDRLHRARLLSS